MQNVIVSDARRTVVSMLPQNSVGVEIGVWKGDYSALIIANAKPATLHLVDPWVAFDDADHADAWYGSKRSTSVSMDRIHESVTKRFQAQIEKGSVIVHRGYSTSALAGFADASVNFVYVDGDHSYDGVKADLEQALRITKPGGLICCDDYSLGSWWKDGVVRAVHECLAANPVVLQLALGSQIVMRRLKG